MLDDSFVVMDSGPRLRSAGITSEGKPLVHPSLWER
jgi:hypothetical protein